jgi:hypothetical protein
MPNNTVVIEVPMTLRVSVAFSDPAPSDQQAAASTLAGWMADRLVHISHAQIDACNELNRLFPHGVGVVTGVDVRVGPTTPG